MSNIIFQCDFCPNGEVDLLRSKGKQVLVYSSKSVVAKKTEGAPTRIKYCCDECLKSGVTTTNKDLTIQGSRVIKKWEDIHGKEHLPSGTNQGLHVGAKD